MSVDLLLSYAFHARTDMAEVREALGPHQRLMIDSGAFTAFTKGKPVDIKQYAKFLDKWRDVFDYAMTLDVIGDTEATQRNLEWLLGEGHDVIPIYTARAPFSEFERLAERFDYIAYGGLVGVPPNLQRAALRHAVSVAHSYGCRVHALGQASLRAFRLTGTDSGDSSRASAGPLSDSATLFDPRTHANVAVRLRGGRWSPRQRRLLSMWGLDLAVCASGKGWSGAERERVFRASALSIACLNVILRNDTGWPRLYSAWTPAPPTGALMAARDWRTGALPPEVVAAVKPLQAQEAI